MITDWPTPGEWIVIVIVWVAICMILGVVETWIEKKKRGGVADGR